MRKLMIIVALVLGAFAVSSSSAKADHWSSGGCNSGWGGYGGGYSYSAPTYYYTPSYSYGYGNNYYPSSGISYSRPGLSISIGNGNGYGYGNYGGQSHRSSGRSHHSGHRH